MQDFKHAISPHKINVTTQRLKHLNKKRVQESEQLMHKRVVSLLMVKE